MAAGRQHGNNDVGLRHRRALVGAGQAAAVDKVLHAGRYQVKAGDGMAGAHQVLRHRQTHIAQPYKDDL